MERARSFRTFTLARIYNPSLSKSRVTNRLARLADIIAGTRLFASARIGHSGERSGLIAAILVQSVPRIFLLGGSRESDGGGVGDEESIKPRLKLTDGVRNCRRRSGGPLGGHSTFDM